METQGGYAYTFLNSGILAGAVQLEAQFDIDGETATGTILDETGAHTPDGTDDPNLIDRALFWTVYKHKQNIYKNDFDTEDYRNIQEDL